MVTANITITDAFAGGNVCVEEWEQSTFRIRPDLRGGREWFYWYFEARAVQPGFAKFLWSQAHIGAGGPAISQDEGKTWRWVKNDQLQIESEDKETPLYGYTHEFSKAGERVRFSVGIPYVQRDLESFLERNSANPHLVQSTLTRSPQGRAVELLQVGQPGAGKRALLLTARHHACEALPNYALEGLLQEAISDSAAGAEFRSKYVLYAVPFVDKDGVEEGDQGKGRKPHDHNRDYGETPIYPEVRAIQQLVLDQKITLVMDMHCPYIKGDVHELFHFLGIAVPPIQENLMQWIAWMNEERPPVVMAPLSFLADPRQPDAVDTRINSHYFATQEEMLFSATLEIPYNQSDLALNADLLRSYGSAMLRAWNRMSFVSVGARSTRAVEAE